MPSCSFGYPGDEGAVITAADHNAGIENCIVLKRADGGKELLVPGTEQNRTSFLYMGLPLIFVLYSQPESPGISPDKPVNKRHEQF